MHRVVCILLNVCTTYEYVLAVQTTLREAAQNRDEKHLAREPRVASETNFLGM
jgi:hypothetical protein